MKKISLKRTLSIFLLLVMLLSLMGCGSGSPAETTERIVSKPTEAIVENTEAILPTVEDSTEAIAAPSETEEPVESTEVIPSTEAETEPVEEVTETEPAESEVTLDENGTYNTKEEVALYIYLYRHLPSNYVDKKTAQNKGWTGGSLEKYFPGCSIGGDRFGNYEGILPKASGRTYTECDIDTLGQKSRGAKRIVFSNDGLIYYTEDHYEHFELLYDGFAEPGTVAAAATSASTAPTSVSSDTEGTDYVINTHNKKFHLPSCNSVATMNAGNKSEFHGTREELIAQGYTPCGSCNP